MGRIKKGNLQSLMDSCGGRFSQELGIDLPSLRPEEVFRWFLASILFGAPISEEVAAQTFRVLDRENASSPEGMVKKGWDGLVHLLDEGGYVRYDFKTATKLLEAAKTLKEEYKGDLNQLHEMAEDPADLEIRIRELAKGIGPVTANIFLREMRGFWKKADPLPGDLAIEAALDLGFLPKNRLSKQKILAKLKSLWKTYGMSERKFADFEATLVRWGIQQRRKRRRLKRGN